jgi:hypothetical protein
MSTERRHAEFFGPDLARGPVLSGSPPVAAVQVATALAQLRVPLLRSDSQIEEHAEFIRTLADKLFPDYAADIRLDVGDESGNTIDTLIRVETGTYTVLRCWLADTKGGGETGQAPDSVTFDSGTVLQTVTTKKHYLIVAPASGVVSVTVGYGGEHNWYWAAARHGRVYYSSVLGFNV